jgi:hypothetical protein
MRPGTIASRAGEPLALVLVLASVPLAVVGVALPGTRYAWMADLGEAVPPDCDGSAGVFLLVPAGAVFLCAPEFAGSQSVS